MSAPGMLHGQRCGVFLGLFTTELVGIRHGRRQFSTPKPCSICISCLRSSQIIISGTARRFLFAASIYRSWLHRSTHPSGLHYPGSFNIGLGLRTSHRSAAALLPDRLMCTASLLDWPKVHSNDDLLAASSPERTSSGSLGSNTRLMTVTHTIDFCNCKCLETGGRRTVNQWARARGLA